MAVASASKRTEETRTKRQLQHITTRILYSGDCDPGDEAKSRFAKAQNIVCHLEVTNNVLISGQQPHLKFFFLPFGRGVHALASNLEAGCTSKCMHFPQIPIHACLLVLVLVYYRSAAPVRLLVLLSVPKRTMPASCEVRNDINLHS